MTNALLAELRRRLSARPCHGKKIYWNYRRLGWQEYWNSAERLKGTKTNRSVGNTIKVLLFDWRLQITTALSRLFSFSASFPLTPQSYVIEVPGFTSRLHSAVHRDRSPVTSHLPLLPALLSRPARLVSHSCLAGREKNWWRADNSGRFMRLRPHDEDRLARAITAAMQRCKRDGRSEHRFDSERVWGRDTTETLTFLDRADIKINQTCLGTRRGGTTKYYVTRKGFFFVHSFRWEDRNCSHACALNTKATIYLYILHPSMVTVNMTKS